MFDRRRNAANWVERCLSGKCVLLRLEEHRQHRQRNSQIAAVCSVYHHAGFLHRSLKAIECKDSSGTHVWFLHLNLLHFLALLQFGCSIHHQILCKNILCYLWRHGKSERSSASRCGSFPSYDVGTSCQPRLVTYKCCPCWFVASVHDQAAWYCGSIWREHRGMYRDNRWRLVLLTHLSIMEDGCQLWITSA